LYQGGAPYCIYNNAYSYEAYRLLAGFKKDSSSVWDPTYSPYRKTKFCFPGDPETNTGWTNTKGYLYGCADSNFTLYSNGNDVRCVIGSGANNFNVNVGETQTIVAAQMIARGSSYLNSVTKVKDLAAYVQNYYDDNFHEINPVTPIPLKYSLYQNFPNPFNATTSIYFDVSQTASVKIVVYDAAGKKIQTLVDGTYPAGNFHYTFDGSGFPSGVYFYSLYINGDKETKRMILIK
jgi:hypothetical protein